MFAWYSRLNETLSRGASTTEDSARDVEAGTADARRIVAEKNEEGEEEDAQRLREIERQKKRLAGRNDEYANNARAVLLLSESRIRQTGALGRESRRLQREQEETNKKLDVVLQALHELAGKAESGNAVLERLDQKADRIERGVQKTGEDVKEMKSSGFRCARDRLCLACALLAFSGVLLLLASAGVS